MGKVTVKVTGMPPARQIFEDQRVAQVVQRKQAGVPGA